MMPRLMWAFARRWLWLFLLGTLLAGIGSYVISSQLPKTYAATAKLLVTPGTATGGNADYNLVLAAERLTRTYAELAKTRPVVEAAVRVGRLDVAYEEAVLRLDVTPVRDTQLIQVTARGGDPDQAATFANLVAAALVQQAEAGQSSRFAVNRDSLSQQMDQLTAEMAKHTDGLGALRAQPPSAERDGQLARIEFELSQIQQTYAAATRSYEDVRLTQARSSDILAVADPATPARTPIQPRMLANVLLAALVGFLLATGVAFLAESLDDRLLSPRRVTQLTGLRVLGTIGLRPRDATTGVHRVPLPPRVAPGRYDAPRGAEPFRLLSANLQAASTERPLRSLLVTSCRAGDGKTTTAVNLAVVLAQAGKQVVLVDADLRAPTLHQVFGIENSTGLSSLLMRDHLESANVAVQTLVDGLRLLPSGPVPADPSELLASQRMRDRLVELRDLADLVIVDSSPVLAVSDPAVLAGCADGVLLVVDAQRTPGQDAIRAVATLRNAGARVVGAVVNRVPAGPDVYGATHAPAQQDQLPASAR